MPLSDQDVLRSLMKSRDRIAAAAWLVVRDGQAAEDIFQNVALKALTREVEFEADGAILSWAFITARREGIDWLRRQRRESSVFEDSLLEMLEEEWLRESAEGTEDARAEALRECLVQMPEKSRQLLKLRYFEGHKCQKIADLVGVSVKAVYKRLSRLHLSLRECIQQRMRRSDKHGGTEVA